MTPRKRKKLKRRHVKKRVRGIVKCIDLIYRKILKEEGTKDYENAIIYMSKDIPFLKNEDTKTEIQIKPS